MNKLVIAIASISVSLLLCTNARAQGLIVVQSAQGSAIACVPLSSSTLPEPWVQTHGKVQHNTTSTTDIVLFCQVALESLTLPSGGPAGSVYGPPPSVFTVKYVDPDATGAQADVLAELKYADAAGNMVELAVASSSAQSNGGTGIATMDAPISNYSTPGGQAFVQLTLHRTSTRLFPAVYGFTIH